jgi:hypothetical protein
MIPKRSGRAVGKNGRPTEVLLTDIRNARLLALSTHKIKPAPVDSTGFIRVSKRKLKGGHPDLRDYRAEAGELATASLSFDLVKAVRINGKPRHVFVLGLGSQKNFERAGNLVRFWTFAISRMKRRGLTYHQRRRLALKMVRKAARLPTLEACETCRGGKELAAIIRAAASLPQAQSVAPLSATLRNDAHRADSSNYAIEPLPNKELSHGAIISREAA